MSSNPTSSRVPAVLRNVRLNLALDIGNNIPYYPPMGTLYKQDGITIRVNGNEHPPVHAHVLHADGKALVYLSGKTLNRGVPADALKAAQAWIDGHRAVIETEWQRWN